MTPRCSVVIPTRGRPEQLVACLEALAADFPGDCETIVVFDGEPPHDGIERFGERLRLKVVSAPHRGPAVARNEGLRLATGDVVMFTDDDCAPVPGWVDALSAGVVHEPPVAAGGATRNALRSNPYADASQVILTLVGEHDRTADGTARFFASCNLAFPRRALVAIGGFDETFSTAEDREVCRRWRGAGHRLEFVPAAVVEHHSRLGLMSFVRQFFRYGEGAARFHAGNRPSLARSAAFHLRLPRVAAPAVRARGPARGTRLVALLALWELANVAGFFTASGRRVLRARSQTR